MRATISGVGPAGFCNNDSVASGIKQWRLGEEANYKLDG
jgi:hypothetical protein